MQIYFVVLALGDKITSKNYGKTINILCAGNKVFVKYQVQWWGFDPKPLAYALVHMHLLMHMSDYLMATSQANDWLLIISRVSNTRPVTLFGNFQIINTYAIYIIRRCLKVLGQRVNKFLLNERTDG